MNNTIERCYYGFWFIVFALIEIGLVLWIVQIGARGWRL